MPRYKKFSLVKYLSFPK